MRDVRTLRFGPGRPRPDVLADRRGFLCRRGPEGTEFEAVALDSARACAVAGADGRLRYVTGDRPGDAGKRAARSSALGAMRTGARRRAEQALAAAARRR